MLTRFRSNVARWPNVFAVLVTATVVTLIFSYGLCRYIGRLDARTSLYLVSAVLVLCAVADGITYALFARTHAFSIASLLDRVEGRNVSADETEGDETLEEEENYDEEEVDDQQ